jgi:hypothetical protein
MSSSNPYISASLSAVAKPGASEAFDSMFDATARRGITSSQYSSVPGALPRNTVVMRQVEHGDMFTTIGRQGDTAGYEIADARRARDARREKHRLAAVATAGLGSAIAAARAGAIPESKRMGRVRPTYGPR